MPRSKKSIVWEHFIKLVDEGNVQCTLCNRKMKFFGNTTNLKEHLRRTHPDQLAANELQNDGYILFVDGPKAKKIKKIKEDDNESTEDINPEEVGEKKIIMLQDGSFSIKENYVDKEGYTISIPRQDSLPTEPSYTLGTDDFSKVVESSAFIDKSLLIEELFRYNYVLITAPHGFCKSTNWDMVKRFLQIEVNEEGIAKDIRQTDNYKIFRDKRLLITERPKFCKDHMGQHPIISIDFKPLAVLDSFDDMLTKLKFVLRKSFKEHKYLLRSPGLLLKSSNELFHKYCDSASSLCLTVPEIEMGFVYLSELLYLHFRKHIVVLIDNYDSYVDSLITTKNPDTEKIVNFIQNIVKELLKSNHFISHAFLTGILPVSSSGINTVSLNIKSFYFLDNHHFCKFYGITSDELSDILKRFMPDLNEREKTERIIAEYYGGYIVPSQNINIYNLWSIINYLENKRVPLNYWCQSEHYDMLKNFFSIKEITEEVQLLLLGMSRCTDISKLMTSGNFRTLSNYLVDKENSSNEAVFLKLLYHLGYVTGSENLTLDPSEVFLKIPNSEIRLELSRILKDTYVQQYAFKERHIRALHSSTNAFSVQSYEESRFEHFCKTLNDLFINSNFFDESNSSNEFQLILFTFMASKFCITQSEIYKNHLSNSVDILTVNDSGVGIFIETKVLNQKKSETCPSVAMSAHRQIIEKKCCEYFDRSFEATMGKICIGVCLGPDNKISIAYSYYFHVGDDIDNTVFLEL